MALLRTTDGFPEVFAIAARDLPDPAAFLEKDYWVTAVLRALNDAAPGGFVLKGGTSLSKGYAIINRFSEDVDILVVPHAGESARRGAGRLKSLTESVAESLGLEWEEARKPGHGRSPSRGDYLRYPAAHGAGFGSTINTDAILFETRIADGDTPSEMCEIGPLIAGWRGIDAGEFEDLAWFRIRVLDPIRTLVEKVVAVHHQMSRWSLETAPVQQRFGRHYYDIYRLLNHQPTLRWLDDRVKFGHLLAEIEMISDAHYAGHTDRPDDGFAASVAFSPPRGSELRAWLEESYRISMELLSPAEQRPTFTSVLRRVEDLRERL